MLIQIQTKIVVFRNRGKLVVKAIWRFNGNPVEVVDWFKYLELTFNFNGIFINSQFVIVSLGSECTNHVLRIVIICILRRTQNYMLLTHMFPAF